MADKNITLKIMNGEEVKQKLKELNSLLKSANSQASELADLLKNLEITIVPDNQG